MSAPAVALDRRIEGRGTDEPAWAASADLADLREMDVDALARAHDTIHIVSPHPDDEVLGLGGLIARWSRTDADLHIVSVTHGTASHPASRTWTPARLAMTRPLELRRALRTLGARARVSSLDLPDGQVTSHEDRLAAWLLARTGPRDLVIAPWRLDGHPDHEASGRAAARAAQECGARFAEYPIWAWHWARPDDARLPWGRARRVTLDAATLHRKRAAIRAFASQLVDDGEHEAVLPAHVVSRFERPFELLFLDR